MVLEINVEEHQNFENDLRIVPRFGAWNNSKLDYVNSSNMVQCDPSSNLVPSIESAIQDEMGINNTIQNVEDLKSLSMKGVKELCGWQTMDELLANSTLDLIFQERFQALDDSFSSVRFPLLSYNLLKELGQSNLPKHIHVKFLGKKICNAEVIGDETNENQNIVDEGEVDDIEADDPEEELDAYEALDLAGDDDEASLLSHSYMGNNSRSYLQELFDSFQPVDASGDKIQDADSSDGEYQIYEQDDDDDDDDDD
ncbi:hypothetical protein GH714_020838 [Hevea brasiliensis]|uniref:Uncharacterized protein n=1 Tax=Hevea brasiliensis TaxID=3981 RepID=A0A6A6LE40_HEVBR|nr:hypothetical protein GH714_020838 [Hevea brasiliensis]